MHDHQIARNNSSKQAIFRTKRRSKSLIPLNKLEQHRARLQELRTRALGARSPQRAARVEEAGEGEAGCAKRPRPAVPLLLLLLPSPSAREEAKTGGDGDCPCLGRKILCNGTGGGGAVASHRTAPVGCGSHVAYLDGRDGPTPAYLPAHTTEWGRRDSPGAELCAALALRLVLLRSGSQDEDMCSAWK